MKFGAEFQEALRREEYPQQWIDSAISYKKLKKCIKIVQQELLSLGLDRDTLEALWQYVDSNNASTPRHVHVDRLMHYQFRDDRNFKFVPKLTITIDPCDGSPMNACLNPETREVLRKVGRQQINGPGVVAPIDHRDQERRSETSGDATSICSSSSGEESAVDRIGRRTETFETIEVPLTSDSKFFQILRRELASLEELQQKEQHEITSRIERLGEDLQIVKASTKRQSKNELAYWREVFRLYIENQIFVSNSESDAGMRPAAKAHARLQQFTREISTLPHSPHRIGRGVSKENHVALDRFVQINTALLQLLKFQELNRTALTKIMKKFDKRTSLHAQASLLAPLTHRPAISRELARATIYTISNNLLQIIPQLDDYLCPVCSEVTYKPIRLRCNHVFCIRCMIRLQRNNKDECPLCREHVVLGATEDQLDKKLKRFLKDNFPEQVKAKQKDNEIQAGIDLFGEDFDSTNRCTVM